MNLKNYKEIVKHNAIVLENSLISRTSDISDIIFYEGVKGKDLSFDKVASKLYDILACCAIGALPSIESTGADGYAWFGKKLAPIETKLCSIEKKNIFVGPRSGLYWSSDPENFYNKAAVRSRLQGSFDSGMTDATLKSKERWTSLVCFDRDLNSVFGAWVLSPSATLYELQRRRSNSSLTLKLSCFMNNGRAIKTMINSKDYFEWEKYQTTLAHLEGRVAKW